MSLKDIQIYLDQRNPQLFLELLNQQEAKLLEYINEMQQIHENDQKIFKHLQLML